ncbi:TEF transcription factor, PAR bZIP family member a isoform X1 [Phyllopteryx taeniolatus]|uniref:TEF transcription factor, PAR bZIP family member a isoform X1 n=1 Tax=Phyllopteryx taeniolatus TaxID=161469 RepID=UPI002AD47A18|nr:TEF transcription factor, PAR bZIP family member a isoform X1 [Phyllopteryx taeniolatus]
MSVEAIVATLEAAAGAPTALPVVLKKIMEMPPLNILAGDDDTDKEKMGLDDITDVGGGGSGMGPSAALTPAIWEKTIPYDGENFHLEYMDLEEFLMENGIATSPEEHVEVKTEDVAVKPADAPLLPIHELDKCGEEVVIITKVTDITCDVTTEVTTDTEGATADDIDPDDVEVDVNYEPDPTDLVLSSVPGGELFDPRKHKFSVEELKPQPMIKKAKKVFVLEEQKDEKYWQRRKKNNVAAKRSRDARRLKENQITVRAAFLERENSALRTEVADLRKECGSFKNIVGKYKAKFGKLAVPEDL